MRNKTKKAPAWFIDLMKNQFGEAQKEIAKILDVSPEWIIQNEGRDIKDFIKEKRRQGQLNREDQKKLAWLLAHMEHISKYAWSRFRLENWDNDYGRAENLKLDRNKWTITAQNKLKAFLERIKRDAKRTFGL